jgi:hypothetical protein
MNKGFVTVFIDNKVDDGRKNTISSDNLRDDKFSHAIAFFIPFSRKRLLFRIG